jgi:acyl transferase domain-containing protein/acyl carrier protein
MSFEPVALIGAACRFPGAPDLAAFAALLASGRDAVGEVPRTRWSRELFYHPDRSQPGKAYTYAAGCLDDVDMFDPMFFGISPREAVQMDPQQRLLLELTHEAIEDAGIDGSRLAGLPIGVYVGGSSSDYATMRLGDPASADAYFMTGSTLCSLANRLSYIFDLRGPSFTVDTACSSALVALHLACEAIRAGEIDAAVVGGVNMLLAPQSFVGFSRASMLSRAGRCHAFDVRADGYVRAEGAGIVLLKPLSAALADGDRIRAVIRETGVNSDGRTTGFSLPNKAAQIALLRDVYERSGVDPDELVYLEAHGTGTPVGDPIEAAAIGAALGQRRARPLPIGSVKTNIGHLEPASGMAGLLKVMLTLEGGVIPASLHCETPNPDIPFEALNLRLVSRPIRLPRTAGRKLAAVNSFGFGGTNAHAIIQSAPVPVRPVRPIKEASGWPPLLLSARSPAALDALATHWRARLANAALDDIAPALRAAARAREHHELRLAVCGATRAELLAGLDAHLDAKSFPALAAGAAITAGRLVLVFAGNGSQWAGMGIEAARTNPIFAAALAEVDGELQEHLGWSVQERLLAPPDEAAFRNTEIAQPLLFAVQVATVAALRALGIEASAHVGHSAGEVAAAWACGAFSLSQAARVIAQRSRHQQATHLEGRMAVLGLSAAAAAAAIAPIGGLELAAINSAGSVTIAGTEAGLQQLGQLAKSRGWQFVPLDLDYGFHSAAMDPIKAPLLADLAGLTAGPTRTDFFSTVTASRVAGPELDATYWWRNVREPVSFAPAIEALLAEAPRIFLEIGPQPVLQSYLHDALRQTEIPGRVLSSLSRRAVGRDPFTMIAARLHVAGCSIAGSAMFDGPASQALLPLYPWQRERFWAERTVEATDVLRAQLDHPLLGYRRGTAPEAWFNHLSLATEPWLADHVVDGSVVFPAAAMLDIALAAARAAHPAAPALEILGFEIARPLILEADRVRELKVTLAAAGAFELSSRARLSDEPWTLHATGRLSPSQTAISVLPRLPPLGAAEPTLSADSLYAQTSRMGLDYGLMFRSVAGVVMAGSSDATVTLMPTASGRGGYLIDPVVLDGSLQGLVALSARRFEAGNRTCMVPWRFGRVRLLRPEGARPVQARLHVTRDGPRSVCADILLLDNSGAVVAELLECWFVDVVLGRHVDPAQRSFRVASVPSLDPLANETVPDLFARAMRAAASVPAGAANDGALLAEAFATHTAFAAMTALAGGERAGFALADLVQAGRLHPAREALARRLLSWLELDGLASERLGQWSLAAECDLPPVDQLWRSLLFDVPDAVAEVALLGVVGEQLAAMLRREPTDDAPPASALIEQMLYASPSGEAGVASLVAAIGAIAEGWPLHRPLRILEIGAQRGVGTRRVLQQLQPHGLALHYVATSAAGDDLPALAEIVTGVPGAIARLWRPRDDPRDDSHGGVADGEIFDIVIGFYPLSRLGLGAGVLAELRDRLAPGGMLLSLEPEPNRVWGMIDGADPEQSGRNGQIAHLREGEEWCAALAGAGFKASQSLSMTTGLWPIALLGGVQHDQDSRRPLAKGRDGVRLLVLADPSNCLAETLVEQLLLAGRPAHLLSPDAYAAVAEAASQPEALELIFLLAEPASDQAAMAESVLWLDRLARHAGSLTEASSPRLWLAITAATAGQPLASALLGLRRVLANELPHVDCRSIRLDPAFAAVDAAARLADEIIAEDSETEIAWTPCGRTVSRVRAGLPAKAAAPSGQARLAVGHPGLLNSLYFQPADKPSPGPGEVAISVRASALNFRDVMWAMGLLPDEALLDGFAGPTLGLECAGIVTALGADVTGLAIGDRVMAFAPASLGTDVFTARHAVVRMPEKIDFASAATIPVAFLTVVYALGTLAQLAQGESVLIHGGAGGVGLAAIQYAKHRGARIFATAGSPVKRAMLRRLGVDHVLDSRTAAFADEVMALTAGQGVDVVLNSLNGELMERSLGVLRPFGRFLELGKRDLYRNTAVGIRPLRHNVSYFAIDADQLPVRRPALSASLFAEIEALFAAGALRPLPHRRFHFHEAVDAFRLMQAAQHIGKIVLIPDRSPPAVAPPAASYAAPADGTFVLTGALEGFGLEAARWLVRQGARHLALLSRRGATTPGAEAVLAAFARQGVAARAFATDVSDEAALAETLAKIRATMPPIVGVVHAAMVLDDALLPQLDAARFERVLRPKFVGAALLDLLTRSDPISLFVLFSSVTTALGNPGQGNYVAANLMLEAVAERRHHQGLPALAVGWGPIGDTGTLSRVAAVSEALLKRLGSAHLRAAEALEALPALLASGVPVVGFADIRWGASRQSLPLLFSRLFADVVDGRGAETAEVNLRDMLADRTPEEGRALVVGMLVGEVAAILKLSAERIDPLRPLADFGMDSLMAMELRLSMEQRFGITLPLLSLSDGATLSTMAARVVRSINGAGAEENVVSLLERFEQVDEAVAKTATGTRGAV